MAAFQRRRRLAEDVVDDGYGGRLYFMEAKFAGAAGAPSPCWKPSDYPARSRPSSATCARGQRQRGVQQQQQQPARQQPAQQQPPQAATAYGARDAAEYTSDMGGAHAAVAPLGRATRAPALDATAAAFSRSASVVPGNARVPDVGEDAPRASPLAGARSSSQGAIGRPYRTFEGSCRRNLYGMSSVRVGQGTPPSVEAARSFCW
mmetsp:Transcript_15364/g.43599  ORF Transcript_15364/g.43599 Transcript_15364/m.43599 type:complete len:205 (-) Transcript_15364:196-810(-)